MLEIAPYIKEVLCRHNAVVIPNLGTFEWHYHPANLERLDKKIFPPTYQLAFNAEKHQDNRQVLAKFIATKKGISLDAATEQLIGYRLAIEKQLLEEKEALIPELGTLKINTIGITTLEISADQDWKITPGTGRPLLDANPILRDKSYLKQSAKGSNAPKRKIPVFWITAASLFAIIGISSIWWLPSLLKPTPAPTDQISELSIMPIVTESQEHVLELISAHENNSISTPIAKADIIEIDSPPIENSITIPIEDSVVEVTEKPEPSPEPEPKEDPKQTTTNQTETVIGNNDYIIVIGVFANADNIARNQRLLQEKGYQVQTKQLASGFTRIAAVVNSASKQELNKKWAKIRSEFTPKAWIARQ